MIAIGRIVGKLGLVAAKHAPTVMTVGGVVGMIGTAVLASKETLSVKEKLNPEMQDLDMVREGVEKAEKGEIDYPENEQRRDKVIVATRIATKVVKHYAPAIILGTVSAASILLAHKIVLGRLAGTAAALASVSNAFDTYRNRVEEAFGPDDVRQRLNEDDITTIEEKLEDGKTEPEEVLGHTTKYSPYAVLFGPDAKGWEASEDLSLMILHAQENYANDVLRSKGYVMLNDVYKDLGLPQTSAGAVTGWVYKGDGDGYISFGRYEENLKRVYDRTRGREITVFPLDFNVDGVIWDQIDDIKIK